MVKTEFWHLDSPDSTSRLAEWVDEEMDLETVTCPANSEHNRAGKRLTNLSVRVPEKAINDDFVWTWYSECLVQDRVLRLLRADGFTGFDVKPVKVTVKGANLLRPPTLWELTVAGWGGLATCESGVQLIEKCHACGHSVYSAPTEPAKLINSSSWDGSDLFIVWPLPAFVFITNRVAQVIRELELSGSIVRPLTDLRFSGTLTPGRLSDFMEKERVRQLGLSLEIE